MNIPDLGLGLCQKGKKENWQQARQNKNPKSTQHEVYFKNYICLKGLWAKYLPFANLTFALLTQPLKGMLGFGQAQKKRGARLRRVGFPVYNLMKSFESGINVLPLLFVSPPFSFIDDTKVQVFCTIVKDRKTNLLKKSLAEKKVKNGLYFA